MITLPTTPQAERIVK